MSVTLKEKGKLDPLKVFLKVSAAYLITRFSTRKEKKKIVLVGGNLGEKYEDNASVFHTYLTKNHSDQVTAYWMYDPKTTYALNGKIPNAIPLGSFKNYLLFFKADYTFHGHSLMYDIAPSVDKFLFLNKKTVITHISHGIEGFKKILIQKEDVPLLKRTDYFNCASNYEKELKLTKWKIPENKLIVTGFPRFDRYPTNKPAEQVKNILMMMTWREWLYGLSEEEFLNSAYFKNTVGIIQHKGIRELLQRNEVLLEIALHPFMKKFENFFTSLGDSEGNIEFLDSQRVSIERSIQESDMLLTDITSVSWDFLYQNKPIIFNMFDQEEYEAKRGSYLDLDKDLYGYKAATVEEVYQSLAKIIEGGINTNEWYPLAPKYIDFFDQQNCERLAQRVLGVA
ncbi:CDP-glycerol glycerophosphotransferase family protein [Planococcus sp. 107-1]|uniref:CDP-glycerol glycerophosphotransferase family protein n=1 Tax=Planococcus sp. 107-1 TaxID=2908840 RepID=UPI001F1802F4|nr:CDP-glycerol glycerophosphotransferase family protein [Planococcus sp. 107-1]UJF26562.1 CDP-glycerol glycerophosphotransferase family protein [Planococcus sp. 107-1]